MKRLALLLLVFFNLPINGACGEKKKHGTESGVEVRQPAVAGGFYPANPRNLGRNIEEFLSRAQTEKPPQPAIGLIVPHAGYVYSGPVAAWAYKAISGSLYDLVIIAGTSHRHHFQGASIYHGKAYSTPLGEVPIDHGVARKLVAGNPLIQYNASAWGLGGNQTVHDREHSLEVQLPFLQKILTRDFKIIPLLFGSQDLQICRKVSATVADILKKEGKKVLLLGSSDLTHYPSYNDANRIDQVTLHHVAAMQIEPLARYFDTFDMKKVPHLATLACGRAGIYFTLLTSRKLGAEHGAVIKYANSADVSIGDKKRVVGYGAVVFY